VFHSSLVLLRSVDFSPQIRAALNWTQGSGGSDFSSSIHMALPSHGFTPLPSKLGYTPTTPTCLSQRVCTLQPLVQPRLIYTGWSEKADIRFFLLQLRQMNTDLNHFFIVITRNVLRMNANLCVSLLYNCCINAMLLRLFS